MSALSDLLAIVKGLLGMRGQPKAGKRVDVKPLPPVDEDSPTLRLPRKPRGQS